MRNIVWGIAAIAICVANGGSVFTGSPSGIDYVYDALGVGLILYGIYQMVAGNK